ncbi:response regulator [Limnochorda pilosa]|uniref:Chemotaxis protein CheY n=1 Tax=Limnochorda pilosa TaxID=1555112 RepID=A0A0K2SNX8_LIMPI|nr:response regulator transcription factor [Limnochorda pilosa]BAS28806.1 chemotaxis protein CheY [Limnochorda pilosa]
MVTGELPGGEPPRQGHPHPGADSRGKGWGNLIRVGIADDHPLIRQAVTTLLAMEPDIRVVGEAGDARTALELVRAQKPDVLLLDINMPGGGLEVARALARERSETRVVALTIHDDEEYLAALVRMGVRGYVLKDEAPQRVVNAIREVRDGGAVLPSKMMARFLDHLGDHRTSSPRPAAGAEAAGRLSAREREVLEGIVEGKSNRQIAQELVITEKTVKNHITHLLEKLQVQDRTQAAVYALRHGLVAPSDLPDLGPGSQSEPLPALRK